MNYLDLNKKAWDNAVREGDNPYTQVVSTQEINNARQGNWSVYLTDLKATPKNWFPDLQGCKILCLASGGGQQAPILAAAGAEVTSLDASVKQLDQDRHVCERDGLDITLVEGDMADLSAFEDDSFDLVFNPVSTLFVPNLAPIWSECYRVTKTGGTLLTGFMNPDEFIFDHIALDYENAFIVKHKLPYIESETLSEEELAKHIEQKEMFHFSHSMETQLGGLLKAGFVINDFYEDRRQESSGNPIRFYMPSYYAAKATKLA